MKKLKSISFWMFVSAFWLTIACEEDSIVRNPISNFSFDIGEDGLTVVFTNESKDAISYAWDFGDGQTSTEKSPTHVYAAYGTYPVKLVATGDTGADKELVKEVPAEEPTNIITIQITRAAALGYDGTVIEVNEEQKTALSEKFELSMEDVTASLVAADNVVTFHAVEGDALYDGAPTANGYGHWFDAEGNVVSWGTNARTYSEFNAETFAFSIGHFPDQAVSGDKFTIKQALMHGDKKFTFVFKITIE